MEPRNEAQVGGLPVEKTKFKYQLDELHKDINNGAFIQIYASRDFIEGIRGILSAIPPQQRSEAAKLYAESLQQVHLFALKVQEINQHYADNPLKASQEILALLQQNHYSHHIQILTTLGPLVEDEYRNFSKKHLTEDEYQKLLRDRFVFNENDQNQGSMRLMNIKDAATRGTQWFYKYEPHLIAMGTQTTEAQTITALLQEIQKQGESDDVFTNSVKFGDTIEAPNNSNAAKIYSKELEQLNTDLPNVKVLVLRAQLQDNKDQSSLRSSVEKLGDAGKKVDLLLAKIKPDDPLYNKLQQKKAEIAATLKIQRDVLKQAVLAKPSVKKPDATTEIVEKKVEEKTPSQGEKTVEEKVASQAESESKVEDQNEPTKYDLKKVELRNKINLSAAVVDFANPKIVTDLLFPIMRIPSTQRTDLQNSYIESIKFAHLLAKQIQTISLTTKDPIEAAGKINTLLTQPHTVERLCMLTSMMKELGIKNNSSPNSTETFEGIAIKWVRALSYAPLHFDSMLRADAPASDVPKITSLFQSSQALAIRAENFGKIAETIPTPKDASFKGNEALTELNVELNRLNTMLIQSSFGLVNPRESDLIKISKQLDTVNTKLQTALKEIDPESSLYTQLEEKKQDINHAKVEYAKTRAALPSSSATPSSASPAARSIMAGPNILHASQIRERIDKLRDASHKYNDAVADFMNCQGQPKQIVEQKYEALTKAMRDFKESQSALRAVRPAPDVKSELVGELHKQQSAAARDLAQIARAGDSYNRMFQAKMKEAAAPAVAVVPTVPPAH